MVDYSIDFFVCFFLEWFQFLRMDIKTIENSYILKITKNKNS